MAHFRLYPGICVQGVVKCRDTWYFRPRSRSANHLTGREEQLQIHSSDYQGKLHYVSRRAHSVSQCTQYRNTAQVTQRNVKVRVGITIIGCWVVALQELCRQLQSVGGTCRLSPQDTGQKVAEISADLGSFGSSQDDAALPKRLGQWRTQEFLGGVQQIQLRTEYRENGIWGR